MNLFLFRRAGLFFVFLTLIQGGLLAQDLTPYSPGSVDEAVTADYFESIKSDPLLLAAFLREMPKGADLHNHLSGAIYAESMIAWLAEDGGCIDPVSESAVPCGSSANAIPAKDVMANPVLYRQVVDAWSMRNYELGDKSGHDHFFDTFGKFSYAGSGRLGDKLAEAATHAERDNVIYLELMTTPDGSKVASLGSKVGWKEGFGAMRDALIAGGLRDSIALASKILDAAEARMQQLLDCNSDEPSDACGVQIRYLYQVARGIRPEQVFAQILAGFEMAESDPRVVGFNLVMPEDYLVPLTDFTLHMQIINFLRPLYSKAHVSLHAGELVPGLVSPGELCCHIRQSIELGHAERIGHGVDITFENKPFDLLSLMKERNVMVEICLTSNEVILGVTGKDHPLHLYRNHDVPTALATDDEGVSRIDLTHEFVKAVLEQNMNYHDLKDMARTSLEHAFVPGESIWADAEKYELIDLLGSIRAGWTNRTTEFFDGSEKARLQMQLEDAFERFEDAIAGRVVQIPETR